MLLLAGGMNNRFSPYGCGGMGGKGNKVTYSNLELSSCPCSCFVVVVQFYNCKQQTLLVP